MVVCSEIRENLQAVDDALPERYPNRMIGELSDMLKDTGAIAVDVGQHMVWSYQSFKNREGQKLAFFRRSWSHGLCSSCSHRSLLCHRETNWPASVGTELFR